MFSCEINQVEKFKDIIIFISSILSDVTFILGKNSIKLQSLDDSNTNLVSMNLKESYFDSIMSNKDYDVSFSIKIFADIIKCTTNKTKNIKLDYSTDSDFLFISFDNMEFELKTMDIEQHQLHIPEVDYDLEIVLDSNEFSNKLVNYMTFGSIVEIISGPEYIEFNTKGDDANIKDKIEPIELLTHMSVFSLNFKLNHLTKLAKAYKVNNRLILSMNSNYPLMLDYSNSDIFFRLYVAPQIE